MRCSEADVAKKAEVAAMEDKSEKHPLSASASACTADAANASSPEGNTEKLTAWFHEEMEKWFDKIKSRLDHKLNSLASLCKLLSAKPAHWGSVLKRLRMSRLATHKALSSSIKALRTIKTRRRKKSAVSKTSKTTWRTEPDSRI